MLPSKAVWFVSGCSSGLGAAVCKYALKQGHRVVATARKPETLHYLDNGADVLKLQLDVTSKTSIDAAIKATLEHFGRIDVVINNAGLNNFMGTSENASEKDMRDLFEVNFWAPVDITKRAVGIFRDINPKNGPSGGAVVQVTSMGGRIAYPASAGYHSSKFALEGFTETISQEVDPNWGIRFLILEPGGIKSNYLQTSQTGPMHPAYTDPQLPMNQMFKALQDPKLQATFAEPSNVAKVLFETLNKDELPLRLVAGADAWSVIKARESAQAEELERWKEVSFSTGGLP